MRNIILICALSIVSVFQAQNFETVIYSYLDQNSEEFNFNRSDLNDFIITNQAYSKSMDLYNVYVQQTHQNIPVINALGSFAINQNRVVNFNHSFVSNLSDFIETTTFSISAEDAVNSAIQSLGLDASLNLILKDNVSTIEFVFESENLSTENIPVKLVYAKAQNGKYRIAWDLSILPRDESHWWSMSVDANTGDILRQNDWMLSCNFNNYHFINKSNNTQDFENKENSTLSFVTDGSQYRAYPLGIESPNHGSRVLLNQPADYNASPFGWHDTDGVAGAEFTTTQGNNVLASEDRDGDNVSGYSPDGGANLNFDFPLGDLPAFMNEDATITNLFVWNNYVHDVWYNYGFDEGAGNFQETNYSSIGIGSDFVVADAQDGAGLNNANFGTPPEGSNPRMQMFLWSSSGSPSNPLTINSPSDIAGDIFGIQAGFGPGLTPTPITADLALIEDDNSSATSTDIHDACDIITNGANLNGKIVVIRRGICTFVEKIEKAQNNGAIAVIMVNNVLGNPITMGGNGNNINIPSIMISLGDGISLITKLQNSDNINATLVNNGPFQVDGDFDNGIVAHEYGHGISSRLTGGSTQANCLFNDEQMGEGWSDWIVLMMTMQPGDTPEKLRGYGTFAISQPTTGTGIRPFPYSTDFSVNPATYDLTNNPNLSIPHGVGFVWATMLWDLTWELIDQYGFDPDLVNGSGGNNIAIQLIVDGMKLQSCNPGFIDGRDAILQADMLANNGANQCFIWKVFANRGLGFSADQGSSLQRDDQIEAFDLPTNIILPCQTLTTQDYDQNSLKFYPNPTNDILNIKSLSETIGYANLKVFDVSGRLLINKPLDFNQSQELDVSQLKTGVYVVKIENSRVNISKKIIVN
ncbi:T9SS-dependent M36 family metallopeptidase [Flavobacterium sp. CS20]|uniref:T9SS-dependent M36 family metallopeptidase n=1 Tax=Flavobacterium sp. CS20 TaxID=2775246 RepID=UPI001B3A1282|nr:T9SS-dependent M36 family metallopeptidase [Flavobacterium sp. CS20]QTY28023.1 T9SS-dependent M36 family metallopeptidase [Flavobacterium sp. CS20]